MPSRVIVAALTTSVPHSRAKANPRLDERYEDADRALLMSVGTPASPPLIGSNGDEGEFVVFVTEFA